MSGFALKTREWMDFVGAWARPSHKEVTSAAHEHRQVPQRLACAGLDTGYETAVEPQLVAQLMTVCGGCTHSAACAHDFTQPDASERVARYCPNTPVIDDLVIARAMEQAFV